MNVNYSQLLQREFDAAETLAVLKSQLNVFFSWGVEKITRFDNRGVLLKVTGHHWKDFVLITLAWDDTYIVSLLDADFAVHKVLKDVYVDVLVETIDKEIEYIADYDA